MVVTFKNTVSHKTPVVESAERLRRGTIEQRTELRCCRAEVEPGGQTENKDLRATNCTLNCTLNSGQHGIYGRGNQ